LALKVYFQCTAAEYAEAVSAHYDNKSIGYYFFIGVVVCLFAIFIVHGLLTRSLPYSVPFLFVLVFVLVWLLLRFVFRPFYLKRDFRRHPNLAREQVLKMDEAGLRVKTDAFQVENSWSSYTKWRETSNFFLLYLGARQFEIVPKRAFSAPQLDEFRELLRRKVTSH